MPPHFLLHWFWLPTSDLMRPLCLLQWHRVSCQPSANDWLSDAGLLCAEPPHLPQRPTGGALDVIRWPSWPPLCLLTLLGGPLHTATNVCREGSDLHMQMCTFPSHFRLDYLGSAECEMNTEMYRLYKMSHADGCVLETIFIILFVM